MANASHHRTGARILAAAAALVLLVPAAASAAPKAGTSSVSQRLIEGCTFEATYTWSGFGSPSQEATGSLLLVLREPGQDDEVVSSTGYSFPSPYSLRAGTYTFQFGDVHSYFTNPVPSADARLVFVGKLVWQKRHYGTLILDAATAESTPISLPAGCLP